MFCHDYPFDPTHGNRQFSESLWRKGIWHALHVWQGRAHSPKYWRKMVELYV